VRVVAGTAGGRRLVAPPGRRLRPTTDRVREAMFSSLASMDAIRDARVLDLFAGTGALGIEALSRGAASATFVDADHAAIRVVEQNLATTGLGARAKVVRADALRFVEFIAQESGDETFDLALVDPPYAFDQWARLLAALPARLAVLETGDHIDIGPPWAPVRSRRHGDTVVTLVRRQQGAPPEEERGGEEAG
jgi:16S rRNA (guanine966-N2)-methyltransferase